MLEQELKKVERLGELALQHLLNGKLTAAKRVLEQLRHSPYVIESIYAELRALAEFYRSSRNGVEARRLIRTRLYYVWGTPELLTSSNFINPEVSEKTRRFFIQFTGATVFLDAVVAVGPEYICTYEALASCESDALGYFFELIPIKDVRAVKVIKVEQSQLLNSEYSYEGIIRTFPFSLAKSLPKSKDRSFNRAIKLLIEKSLKGSPDLRESEAPIPSSALSEAIHDRFSDYSSNTSLAKRKTSFFFSS
jgi:hypothetical protein